MKPQPNHQTSEPPLFEPEENATYQLEIVEKLTGVPSQTILHYLEIGLVRTSAAQGEFDEETLRTLRLIEHLRETCEVNMSGLKLILELMNQVEALRAELRARMQA
jgi:MerR family transcriptional regulator/heat shock protein HspR